MPTPSSAVQGVWFALLLVAGATSAEAPNLGKPVGTNDVAAWDISIQPNGAGLPPGGGIATDGARIYSEKCAQCHGPDGKGGVAGANAAPLVGGGPITDISAAMKTIANFWPYAPTLFDYIHRAMPYPTPGSLSNDETYAVVAYILSLNGIVPDDAKIDRTSLPSIKMPNRDGFIPEPEFDPKRIGKK